MCFLRLTFTSVMTSRVVAQSPDCSASCSRNANGSVEEIEHFVLWMLRLDEEAVPTSGLGEREQIVREVDAIIKQLAIAIVGTTHF